METTYQLATAMACAAGLLTLFALIRQAMRTPSAPTWIASTFVAYVSAVALTLGFAGSLFYLGSALQSVAPGAVAFFGTFVIHIAMVALLLKLLPAEEAKGDAQSAPEDALPANAVAS